MRASRWQRQALLALVIASLVAASAWAYARAAATGTSSNRAGEWARAALEDLALGRLDSGIGKLRLSLMLDASQGETQLVLALALAVSGQLEPARAALRQAEQVGVASPLVAALEGEVELAAGRPAEAALAYDRGLAEWPEAARLHLGLARAAEMLHQKGSPRQAAGGVPDQGPALKRRLSPGNWWDEALARYDKAAELAGDLAEAYAGAGRLLLEAGRVDDAIGRLQAGLERNPRAPELTFLLGLAREAKGERQVAIQLYERTLQLDPLHPEALEHLNQLQS